MTILIYLFTVFSNFIFAFKKNESKTVVALTLVVICLLMSGAGPEYLSYNNSRDYKNYLLTYESLNDDKPYNDYEIGFTLLMKLGSSIHLDFFIFRLAVIAVCLILIYKFVIKRYAYNSNYVLMMYMIFPMIIDSEHLRNFIALTLLLIAVRFLEKKQASNNIIFLVMIFISGCFHAGFFFYSSLIFVNTKNKNRLIIIIVSVAIFITLITIVNHNQIPFISLIISLFDNERALDYLGSTTKLGYLIPMLLQLTSIMLIYWSKKIISKKNKEQNEQIEPTTKFKDHTPLKEEEIANLVFWINVIGIIFFPLFIMSLQFSRLIRNFLLLNIIVYSIASYKFNRGSAYKFGFNLLIIASLLLWLYLTLTVVTTAERILIPFFTQNTF